jgi:hypothetical protein
MSDEASLFEPGPMERAYRLRAFAAAEREQRERMVSRHPENAEYWHARRAEAERAVDDADSLIGYFAATLSP